MAKIYKPIFACFGIKELCQFWHFQRLPNSAKYNSAAHYGNNSSSLYMLMFTIHGKNVYFYISTYIVGLGFFIILAKSGKTHIFANLPLDNIYVSKTHHLNFQKRKPKPTINVIASTTKTLSKLPYLDMLGMNN